MEGGGVIPPFRKRLAGLTWQLGKPGQAKGWPSRPFHWMTPSKNDWLFFYWDVSTSCKIAWLGWPGIWAGVAKQTGPGLAWQTLPWDDPNLIRLCVLF